MKLKESFVTHVSDGEQITIDTGNSFAGLIRSNMTAAFIIECLKEEVTIESIVNALFEKYDAPMERIQTDVLSVIDILRSVGALEE